MMYCGGGLNPLPAELVDRALMPKKQRVMGSYPTQGSSFVLEKRVVLGVVDLFAFALHYYRVDAYAYT